MLREPGYSTNAGLVMFVKGQIKKCTQHEVTIQKLNLAYIAAFSYNAKVLTDTVT